MAWRSTVPWSEGRRGGGRQALATGGCRFAKKRRPDFKIKWLQRVKAGQLDEKRPGDLKLIVPTPSHAGRPLAAGYLSTAGDGTSAQVYE